MTVLVKGFFNAASVVLISSEVRVYFVVESDFMRLHSPSKKPEIICTGIFYALFWSLSWWSTVHVMCGVPGVVSLSVVVDINECGDAVLTTFDLGKTWHPPPSRFKKQ